MEKFNPNKIDIYSINNGYRYEKGQGISADAINAPIEASAYAQSVADQALVKADEALQYAMPNAGVYPVLSAYPIGSIYMSFSNVSPAEIFGGVWERIMNRFLYCSGEGGDVPVGATGGTYGLHLRAAIGNVYSNAQSLAWKIAQPIPNVDYSYGGTLNPISGSGVTEFPSESINHSVPVYDVLQNTDNISIFPPYIAVNAWRRIA